MLNTYDFAIYANKLFLVSEPCYCEALKFNKLVSCLFIFNVLL
jgi:hypothetical protein